MNKNDKHHRFYRTLTLFQLSTHSSYKSQRIDGKHRKGKYRKVKMSKKKLENIEKENVDT